MGLSSAGIGSGLDVQSLVASLVSAEITPRQKLHDAKLNTINTQLSAVGQLKSSLANLQTTLAGLSDISKLYTLKPTISDESYLSVNLNNSSATTGTYQIEVQKMAQAQNVASLPFTTSSSGGELIINFGTYNSDKSTFIANNTDNTANPDFKMTVNPGDSLVAIKDAINNKKAGVTANIIQDNNGSRLTLTSTNGENHSMQISGVDELTYNPTSTNPSDNKLIETIRAQNSVTNINGLILTQNSNELENVISGVTISLKQAQTGKNITVTIAPDKMELTNLINDFVKKYNDSLTFLNSLTNYDSATKKSGTYMADSQLRNLKLNMNKLATNTLSANNTSSIQSLADLGITTNNTTGLLDINTSQLETALTSNYNDIGGLFAKTALTSDANVRINTLDQGVKAGTYDITITQYIPTLSGTIGGFPATSSDGITLTGSGDLKGISIDVLSGTDLARGTIKVTDGFAVQLNSFLDEYMSTDGNLSQKTLQLNEQIKQLAESQTKIDARGKTLESRYLKQFSALDVLVSQMQATSSYLTQQLDNLPGFTDKSRK
ncbi:MAG: flagellar filament capping protein FliD [bacterium]|nr:flagellar filament capping protein FliD [bacterium]